jgi:hypothetical protein
MNSPSEQVAYNLGVRAGLELAAQDLEHVARLAMSILEADCSPEARMYRQRAHDIRALKEGIAIGQTQ